MVESEYKRFLDPLLMNDFWANYQELVVDKITHKHLPIIYHKYKIWLKTITKILYFLNKKQTFQFTVKGVDISRNSIYQATNRRIPLNVESDIRDEDKTRWVFQFEITGVSGDSILSTLQVHKTTHYELRIPTTRILTAEEIFHEDLLYFGLNILFSIINDMAQEIDDEYIANPSDNIDNWRFYHKELLRCSHEIGKYHEKKILEQIENVFYFSRPSPIWCLNKSLVSINGLFLYHPKYPLQMPSFTPTLPELQKIYQGRMLFRDKFITEEANILQITTSTLIKRINTLLTPEKDYDFKTMKRVSENLNIPGCLIIGEREFDTQYSQLVDHLNSEIVTGRYKLKQPYDPLAIFIEKHNSTIFFIGHFWDLDDLQRWSTYKRTPIY